MSRAPVVLKFFLSQTLMLLQNAAKASNSLGYWSSNLWAAELDIYYSNVYGKISFNCSFKYFAQCIDYSFNKFLSFFILMFSSNIFKTICKLKFCTLKLICPEPCSFLDNLPYLFNYKIGFSPLLNDPIYLNQS